MLGRLSPFVTPTFENTIDRVAYSIARIYAAVPMHQQLVISRMSMTDCCYNRSTERLGLKRSPRCGASDATAAAT
jgi:hypothetical protein